MSQDSEQSSGIEERLQTIRDGVKLVTQAARPGLAESLKLARDALHTLDTVVAGGLRKVREPRSVAGLYVLIDPTHCNGRDPIEVAARALEGGASMIQWRDKERDKGDQLPVLRDLRQLCNRHVALLIVNDHADLALASGADGVHVGQHDLPVSAVRKIVPADFLIGCSTNSAEEAQQAERDGANYIAVGRVFPSTTKASTRDASPETLRQVKRAVTLPLVAIGGITPDNVDLVIEAGADAAAVIGAVCEAADIEEAALVISKRFEIAAEKKREAKRHSGT
ncbi:MAG: thiamine phosphate synthase [Dehalococcoidia bacterium]